MAKQFAVYVRPELFHDVETGVQTYLLTPFVKRVSNAPIRGGVVGVGNARSHGIAEEFRNVEAVAAIVIACDHLAAHGVAGPLQKSSRALGEIARVLMK